MTLGEHTATIQKERWFQVLRVGLLDTSAADITQLWEAQKSTDSEVCRLIGRSMNKLKPYQGDCQSPNAGMWNGTQNASTKVKFSVTNTNFTRKYLLLKSALVCICEFQRQTDFAADSPHYHRLYSGLAQSIQILHLAPNTIDTRCKLLCHSHGTMNW